jgi:hypothetical protein
MNLSWNNLSLRAKRITLWGGAFSALVTAIFSFTQAITATETYHPALKGWVKDEIARTFEIQVRSVDTLTKQLSEGQLETVEVRRSMVEKELFELDLTMQSQANLSDSIKGQLNTRRAALTDDKKLLDYRYDTLQRARSGRRP